MQQLTPDGLVVDGHLGGYVPGGDDATFYPQLWSWIVEWLPVRSVIDVGCGDGVALRYFRDLGCRAVGVDGIPQDDPDIVEHDYTLGPYGPPGQFDLCWSCEFVEHVEERYVPNFLETFRSARRVLLTHASPGQPGHHHVNCQDEAYWTRWLATVGFSVDPVLTTATRRLALANPSPWNHFGRSGLAFERTG